MEIRYEYVCVRGEVHQSKRRFLLTCVSLTGGTKKCGYDSLDSVLVQLGRS